MPYLFYDDKHLFVYHDDWLTVQLEATIDGVAHLKSLEFAWLPDLTMPIDGLVSLIVNDTRKARLIVTSATHQEWQEEHAFHVRFHALDMLEATGSVGCVTTASVGTLAGALLKLLANIRQLP